jgi:hypothetical protein
MNIKMNHTPFIYLLLISLPLCGFAQPDLVSRAEFSELVARIDVLEKAVLVLKEEQVNSLTQEALAALPEQAKSEANLIETVVAAVKQREQEVKFPWMDDAKWAPIRKGLSVEQVVALLGKPTLNEPSLRKWVDFVYTYQGRRPATNKRIVGKVRFRKGVVVDVEPPVMD